MITPTVNEAIHGYWGYWFYSSNAGDMRVSCSRVTSPTLEAVTLPTVQTHLRVASNDETAYLQDLIAVARELVENFTGRALMTSTWLAVCRNWPWGNLLPLSIAPVASITHIKYYAAGATTLTTLDAANYSLTSGVNPAQIVFVEGFSAPSLADRPDAVQVTFVAGATAAASVPPTLKHALLITISNFYERRAAVEDVKFSELPFGLRHLLESNRVAGWVG